ncbi:hypothetical protein AAFF_G00038880 [Aldrovandia affinis]|uniref:Secreted protein n=1 Tax=Aldrovandia affinis TaxID=143900 RepID=A0AAD7WYS0_9TELE|nr:hypothetical protein AAFF_G00038880 [Aldrovandia affinis]
MEHCSTYPQALLNLLLLLLRPRLRRRLWCGKYSNEALAPEPLDLSPLQPPVSRPPSSSTAPVIASNADCGMNDTPPQTVL